jgi:hypothetical protein
MADTTPLAAAVIALRDEWHKDWHTRAMAFKLDPLIPQIAALEQKQAHMTEALSLAECVYRLNCVAPGEPSSILDALQRALRLAQPDPEQKPDTRP